MSGLTSNEFSEPKEEKVNDSTSLNKKNSKQTKNKINKEPKERISTLIDKELMGKIRTISKLENVPINNIIKTGLEKFLKKYESANGPVSMHEKPKREVSDLF